MGVVPLSRRRVREEGVALDDAGSGTQAGAADVQPDALRLVVPRPAPTATGATDDAAAVLADQETMAAVAAGDAAAFRRLVDQLSPILLRFARSMLDSTGDDAEEVVQEALIRLWRNAHAWQPTGRVGPWVHRVAYRLCIDMLRRRRPSVALDDLADVLPDTAPLPGTRMRRLEDVSAIRAAIAELPARQRAALVLCHFQGLNQAEGASVMGVGEHAYESLLARARRNLRTRLSNGRVTP